MTGPNKLLSEAFTARLIKKAWEIPPFRRKLLASPKQALEEAFHMVLPSDVTIHIHEETDSIIHLILPAHQEITADESPESPASPAPETRRQFELQLQRRAMRDEAFRSLLFAEPKKAIEEAYGETIHPSIQIYVHEQTDQSLHIVLPWNPIAQTDGSLDEQELEKITGGVLNCYSEAVNTNICTGV